MEPKKREALRLVLWEVRFGKSPKKRRSVMLDMLEFCGIPEILSRDEGKIRKRVRFIGRHNGVRRVMEARAKEKSCRQWPRRWPVETPTVICVDYVVDEDEFVFITQVYVSLRPRRGLGSCFFDPNGGRQGTVKRGKVDQFVYHYCTLRDFIEIESSLSRLEEEIAVSRLAKLGPDGFPEETNGGDDEFRL